ncbi:hypothetical protein ACWIGX_38780 [Streptomyces nigrescens]
MAPYWPRRGTKRRGTASYLHTLIQRCARPQHATAYAGMIRADPARRTLRELADRLCQTATDTTLPDPAVAVLAQADALGGYLNELTPLFTPHPGSCRAPLHHRRPRPRPEKKPSTRSDCCSPPPPPTPTK